jgi:hypothetical protein
MPDRVPKNVTRLKFFATAATIATIAPNQSTTGLSANEQNCVPGNLSLIFITLNPDWTGVRTGAMIDVITALIAVLMQIGYYTAIHPAWPEYMSQQAREYFSRQGLSQAQTEKMAAEAHQGFSLESYATQSALTALLAGIVLSAIIMIFLRHRRMTGT